MSRMESQSTPSKPTSAKKPYAKPQLRLYGKLGQITAAVMMVGNADGSMTTSNKTS